MALAAMFGLFIVAWVVIVSTPSILGRVEKDLAAALSLLVSVGVTVLVTTFSFVFVALSLVSVQFSPRVVRHFWHGDRFRFVFLWSSIAVFLLCFVLVFVHSTRLQLLGALLGVYQIFVVFPTFLGYLADNLNAASITKNISDNTVAQVYSNFEELDFQSKTGDKPGIIRAEKSGFLNRIDTEKLASAVSRLRSSRGDVELASVNYLGSFIEVGSVLAVITPPVELTQRECEEISRCFFIHKFRNYEQDVEYGIRQLVDIGVKAISPAVNDPTTCVNCIHYLGVIIKELAGRDDVSIVAKSMREKRILLKEPTFEQYVDDAFDQIFQYGRRDHVIVRAIIAVMTEVIEATRSVDRAEVIVKEIADMELRLLDGDPKSFVLAEQRNYILKSLAKFYAVAGAKFEDLDATERAIEMRRLSTSCGTK